MFERDIIEIYEVLGGAEKRRINVDFSLAQRELGMSGEMGIKSKGLISLCRSWLG